MNYLQRFIGHCRTVNRHRRLVLLEMICDRVAASMTYCKEKYTDSSALEYYNSRKQENNFHPTTRAALEAALKMIAEKGMDAEAIKQVIADIYHSQGQFI